MVRFVGPELIKILIFFNISLDWLRVHFWVSFCAVCCRFLSLGEDHRQTVGLLRRNASARLACRWLVVICDARCFSNESSCVYQRSRAKFSRGWRKTISPFDRISFVRRALLRPAQQWNRQNISRNTASEHICRLLRRVCGNESDWWEKVRGVCVTTLSVYFGDPSAKWVPAVLY